MSVDPMSITDIIEERDVTEAIDALCGIASGLRVKHFVDGTVPEQLAEVAKAQKQAGEDIARGLHAISASIDCLAEAIHEARGSGN